MSLDAPGTYLHWHIVWISVANLAVIGSMLAIFAAALLLPFPAGRHELPEAIELEDGRAEGTLPAASTSWTGRVRGLVLRWLPPQRLLPETQPSYVASWAYVFGVASLAALALAVVSGFLIALGGVEWWHSNPAGHFFNSMHLWSVEMFMAFLVIHLWAKFFMAAWRGGRARTWITGVLAFLVSIGEAFTGYLSQQNFDSQWISTNGKDAFNSAGIGGWFNLMDFGQMLLWHVVLLPLVLVGIVVLHVLFVRYRSVVHPFPARRGRDALGQPIEGPPPRPSRRERRAAERAAWRGPVRPYDLIREAVAATAIVAALTFVLAGGFSSPDVPPITVQRWAKATPADFVGTAASELAGTSETATYGPPYNRGTRSVQEILGVSWQRISGVWSPIDAAQAFVVNPLTAAAGDNPTLRNALSTWKTAPAAKKSAWAHAYLAATDELHFNSVGAPVVPAGSYGPVPEMMQVEYTLARSGALDASLLAQHEFYGTDFTKPLLFLEDGSYFQQQARAQHLLGDQWGVMNETGSYPGQPWLWLYQLWYHVPGLSSTPSVDLAAIYLITAATLLLALVPFIPGLRDIPRLIPLYRIIWRSYYREAEQRSHAAGELAAEPRERAHA